MNSKDNIEKLIIYFINPFMVFIDRFILENRFKLLINSMCKSTKASINLEHLSIKIAKSLFFDSPYLSNVQGWSTNYFFKPLPQQAYIKIYQSQNTESIQTFSDSKNALAVENSTR
nr:hypothetical protein [Trentepohlia sp. YN1317]